MSAEKHTKTMLLACLARLHETDHRWIEKSLARWGFDPGDVSFRLTNKGQAWIDVHRWPWETERKVKHCTGCGVRLLFSDRRRGFETCGPCAMTPHQTTDRREK